MQFSDLRESTLSTANFKSEIAFRNSNLKVLHVIPHLKSRGPRAASADVPRSLDTGIDVLLHLRMLTLTGV